MRPGPADEQLPNPQKAYCLWCGRETYSLTMFCGRCAFHSEREWFLGA